jgi:hypothetical protein
VSPDLSDYYDPCGRSSLLIIPATDGLLPPPACPPAAEPGPLREGLRSVTGADIARSLAASPCRSDIIQPKSCRGGWASPVALQNVISTRTVAKLAQCGPPYQSLIGNALRLRGL